MANKKDRKVAFAAREQDKLDFSEEKKQEVNLLQLLEYSFKLLAFS